MALFFNIGCKTRRHAREGRSSGARSTTPVVPGSEGRRGYKSSFNPHTLIGLVRLVSPQSSIFTPHPLGIIMSHNDPEPRRPEDIGDGYYRADSFPRPETTPHPFLPEREHANAPPHSMPMVSVSGYTAPTSGLTVKSWRPDFPHLAQTVRQNGARLLRTQAFRNSATTCRTTLGRMRSLSTMLHTLL